MKRLFSLLLMLAALPAHAHTRLLESTPADGSTLQAAPRQLQLTYSEAAHLTALTIQAAGEATPRKLGPLPQQAAAVRTPAQRRTSPGRSRRSIGALRILVTSTATLPTPTTTTDRAAASADSMPSRSASGWPQYHATRSVAAMLPALTGCDPRSLAYFLQPFDPVVPPPVNSPLDFPAQQLTSPKTGLWQLIAVPLKSL